MMERSDDSWNSLHEGLRELNERYSNEMVLIGGVAVYLHSTRLGVGVERTHDVDLMLGMNAYSQLSSEETLTHNRRLDKHEITTHGTSVDVYVEFQNQLRVPYEEAKRHAVEIDGYHCASLEHLLVLKTVAAIDRAGNPKGDKDERDIAKIVMLMERPNGELLSPYLKDGAIAKKLDAIGQNVEVFARYDRAE